ncbi:MAG: tyrosine-protein phosphatase [Hyphomicrobiales bacterium]|nr:tyrosine-protein phosphatase [Hyphomicrobiales bacterium]
MRQIIRDRAPPWIGERAESAFDYFDVLFVDHGVFRAIYPNRHKLAADTWRSAQPAPRDIRKLAKRGVKTIVNLRGERDCGSYRLQQAACARYRIRLINFSVKSRQAPPAQTIRAAKDLFDSIEYPMLMHCKSGADRAGLMSTLYMILKQGVPVQEATRQLSLLYGHIKQADTGVLDLVFESYLAHNSHQPITFMDWVDQYYDCAAIDRTFKASGLANVMVNKVLHRE